MIRPDSLAGVLSQELEGARYDSHGAFSTEAGRGLPEYGRLFQQNPAAPWLFLIQVAVALRSPGVKLQVEKRSLAVTFQTRDWVPELEQHADPFSTLLADENAPLELLRKALLWCTAGAPGEVGLRVEGERSAFLLTTREGGWSRAPIAHVHQNRLTLVWVTRRWSAADRARLHAEFSARLKYCPVPVWLDGHLLTRGSHFEGRHPAHRNYILAAPDFRAGLGVAHPWFYPAESFTAGRLHLTARDSALGWGDLEFSGYLPEGMQKTLRCADGLAISQSRGPENGGDLIWLVGGHLPRVTAESRPRLLCRGVLEHYTWPGDLAGLLLEVVRLGVACDPVVVRHEHGPGWTGAVAAYDATVDLSGFKVVQDAAFARLQEQVCQRIAATCLRLGPTAPD